MAPYTSLKAGYSQLGSDYTHRIWETTNEDVFKVSLDSTGNQRFMLRAQYENRQRTGDGFDADALARRRRAADDAALRHRRSRPHPLHLHRHRGSGEHDIELNASAGVGRDEYTESEHGLLSFDSNQYSIGANIAPDDRYQPVGQLRLGELLVAAALAQRQRRGCSRPIRNATGPRTTPAR